MPFAKLPPKPDTLGTPTEKPPGGERYDDDAGNLGVSGRGRREKLEGPWTRAHTRRDHESRMEGDDLCTSDQGRPEPEIQQYSDRLLH